MNLLLNANGAMSAVRDRLRELVTGTLYGAGEKVIFAVRDFRSVVHPLSAPRIFDAFYASRPGGLGMGRVISRSIAEWCGGGFGRRRTKAPARLFQVFTLIKF
jgi:C4-dicarboxylate-specific signal transduction histidine kinase